jgi:hypothetical protein
LSYISALLPGFKSSKFRNPAYYPLPRLTLSCLALSFLPFHPYLVLAEWPAGLPGFFSSNR